MMENKMRSYHKLSLVLLFTLTINAMAADKVDRQQTSNINVSDSSIYGEDKPNLVITNKNPTFSLRLKSNPSTGYQWFLREYDADLIQPVSQHYVPGDANLIGTPGYDIWTFKVKPAAFSVPQQTVIRLIYARAWQGAEGSTQIVFRVSTQKK